MKKLVGVVVVAAIALRSFPVVKAEPQLPLVSAFIDRHCVECHDSPDHESRLDLTKLAYQPSDAANLSLWVRIHDRVRAGEMPPTKDARPEPAELAAFVKTLGSKLTASERALLAEGRSVRRERSGTSRSSTTASRWWLTRRTSHRGPE